MREEITFLDYFEELDDPRVERTKLYPVDEILLTTFAAVICGAEGWNDVEMFGHAKIEFLKTYLPFKNGIPSDDTFRRFFRCLDHKKFQSMFITWVESLHLDLNQQVIAIDGKTSRRTHDGAKKALHLVSAFASESRMVLGQVKTEEKSNEIRAIPELLDLLHLEKGIVSIDAMGCQRKIAQKIRSKEADYIFSLKGNQSALHEDIRLFFEDDRLTKGLERHQSVDGGHGRIETRICTTTADIEWLKERHDWEGLQSIARIESITEREGKPCRQVRYFISSLDPNAEKILSAVPSHWAVENSLHWVLDVSFNDDQSRIRSGNAPENMAIMKHVSLNLIRQAKKKPDSIKGNRKKAGWDNLTLQSILQSKFR